MDSVSLPSATVISEWISLLISNEPPILQSSLTIGGEEYALNLSAGTLTIASMDRKLPLVSFLEAAANTPSSPTHFRDNNGTLIVDNLPAAPAVIDGGIYFGEELWRYGIDFSRTVYERVKIPILTKLQKEFIRMLILYSMAETTDASLGSKQLELAISPTLFPLCSLGDLLTKTDIVSEPLQEMFQHIEDNTHHNLSPAIIQHQCKGMAMNLLAAARSEHSRTLLIKTFAIIKRLDQ